MNYFIDTNIPLGYSIIYDQWHDVSKNFINTHQNDSVFWSNLVKKEYTKKFNEIISNVTIFLNHCKRILKDNQKDFVNYFNFENFLMKKTKICSLDNHKKQKILEQFWKKYKLNEGISEVVYLNFNEFIHEFEKQYHIRDKKLKGFLIFHECGLDNYLIYLNYAKQLNNWGVHTPDCKIVTDAHDCGLQHDNVIFVSTDEKMINTILKHDHSFLSIIEFRSCN